MPTTFGHFLQCYADDAMGSFLACPLPSLAVPFIHDPIIIMIINMILVIIRIIIITIDVFIVACLVLL